LIDKFRHLKPQIKRYLVIGVSVYMLELLIIITAQSFGASSVIAVTLSFWIGIFSSFLLQKFITFGDKRVHHRVLLSQIILYSLLVLFNFGFTLVLTKMLSSTMPVVFIRTLAIAITTIWNYYLYKTHIFNIDNNTVY